MHTDILEKLKSALQPQSTVGLYDNASASAKATADKHSRHQILKSDYKRVLIHNTPFLFTGGADGHLQILKNHSLIISNGLIASVLPATEIKLEGFDLIYDAGKRGGVIITPGLINTHAHSHMYLMRSAMMLDEGEGVDETIAAMGRWARYETDDSYALAAAGDLTEQQKSGITTTLAHGPSFEALETAAKLTNQNVINAVSAISNSRPTNTPEAAEKYLSQNNWQSVPAISIHYLYKASLETLKKIRSLSERYNTLVTFHMAESPRVAQDAKKIHGSSEVELLAATGLLNEHSLAAHVIYVNDEEIAKLVEYHVGIAHLPTSNVIHKSGTFPFWKFEDAGGFPYLSLGTDSVVSKSRLDILSEAYQTRLTHLFDRTVKFSSLFKMMTVNGARVLHAKDRGRIAPGFKADLAFWKLKDRGTIPYDEANPITLLGNLITHGGRFVRDLMINGQFVIKDRRHALVDESRLLSRLQQEHMAMRQRIQSASS